VMRKPRGFCSAAIQNIQIKRTSYYYYELLLPFSFQDHVKYQTVLSNSVFILITNTIFIRPLDVMEFTPLLLKVLLLD